MLFATMFLISTSPAYSQAINPTSNCDRSTVGETKEFSGCDRSAHVIEIDTYECILLDNGAYKWDLVDVRHTNQSC
jgi:hypothetical protein